MFVSGTVKIEGKFFSTLRPTLGLIHYVACTKTPNKAKTENLSENQNGNGQFDCSRATAEDEKERTVEHRRKLLTNLKSEVKWQGCGSIDNRDLYDHGF